MELPQNKTDINRDMIDELVADRQSSLTKLQQKVLSLIYADIKLDTPYYQNNPLAPTPLDGRHLMIMNTPYVDSSMSYMEDRLHDRLDELGAELADYQEGAIIESIVTEHRARVDQNTASLQTLQYGFLQDPESIPPSDARIIYRARRAAADQLDIIQLLAKYPEIGGIEDAKFTRPLHPIELGKAMRDVHAKTRRIRYERPDFRMRVLSPEEQEAGRRIVDVGDLSQFGIFSTKKPILHARYQDVAMVKKMRESMILLPAARRLGDNPVYMRNVRGELANMQHIGFTTYWSLRNASDDINV